MTTRLYNAKILNKDWTITQNGTILIQDGIIKHIAIDETQPAVNCQSSSVDCQGNLLIPSFKNAHTHSAMTFLRSRADDLPLQEWLFEQIFPQEAKLTAEHIHHFTKLAILEYLSSGITAAFDMYFEPEAVACAARDMGFRITMCGSVNNFGTTPQLMRDFYEKYRRVPVHNGHVSKDSLIDYKLGFHAEYTNSIENMTAIAEMSEHYKAPVYTHMSETLTEHNECIERHGKTPAALFTDLKLWNNGGGVFHAVHVDDNDIALMAEKGIWAVSNPGSNLKLASGIAPLTKMKNIALGTDGPASNNALSMFREMYFACTLQKHLWGDAAACPAYNAVEWATANSAKAMGLTDCDCLEAGKKADIVMIDLNRPSMIPHNNIVKNMVYSGDTSVVKMTMVDGVIRYKDGEFFVGEDSQRIIEKAHSLMKDFI
jgi:5-methylthioadenosine/S-adenosylhomocysteine deaminase